MILLLRSSGDVQLEQPLDFARFHCEIDAPAAALPECRAKFTAIGELQDEATAWIHRDALLALGPAAEPDWRERTLAMLNKAAQYGWVRDREPSIQSHIVWRR